MRTEFELACNELGWGDAVGGLWFIGLEEASAWQLQSDTGAQFTIDELREKIHEHFSHADPFRPPELDAAREPVDAERSSYPVRDIQAKICALLASGEMTAWEKWRDWLWKRGSRVAQGNLFPLGRPTHDSWPEHYEELFGVSASDYYDWVEARRFRHFRDARDALRPQAIVCFGSGEWDRFARCFGIQRHFSRQTVDGRLLVYDADHVLMTEFFNYRFIGGNDGIQPIVSVLREWDVHIGPLVEL